MPAAMSSGLALQDLACVRGRRSLFSGLNLALAPGQLLRVAGANGAGKTSLLRMLCGLLAPAEGQVLWQGQPLPQVREAFHRELVYLGHAAALKDELSALENLQTACCLAGHAPPAGALRAALADAGLRGREQVPARTLSQGQRRRAVLARLTLGVGRAVGAGRTLQRARHPRRRLAVGPDRRAAGTRRHGGADQPPAGGAGR